MRVFGEIGPHRLHVLAERLLEGGRIGRTGQVAENEGVCFLWEFVGRQQKDFLKRGEGGVD